jgi:hypothetical protein
VGTTILIYLAAFIDDLMSIEENMQLMKTLDDAWNSQDWEEELQQFIFLD